MASLSVQSFALDASGLSITYNATAASGDSFTNNGKTVILAKNGATAGCTVTIAANQTVTDASLAIPDLTVSIGTSVTVAIGPLPKATFNDGTGSVDLTYANRSTLTIGLVTW